MSKLERKRRLRRHRSRSRPPEPSPIKQILLRIIAALFVVSVIGAMALAFIYQRIKLPPRLFFSNGRQHFLLLKTDEVWQLFSFHGPDFDKMSFFIKSEKPLFVLPQLSQLLNFYIEDFVFCPSINDPDKSFLPDCLLNFKKTSLSKTQRFKLQTLILMKHFANSAEFVNVADLADWRSLSAKSRLQLEPECRAAVINTTDKSGRAGRFATILESYASSIIKVADSDRNLKQSQIWLADQARPRCHSAVIAVSRLLPSADLAIGNKLKQQYRADLVILLGQDWMED